MLRVIQCALQEQFYVQKEIEISVSVIYWQKFEKLYAVRLIE